MEHTIEFKVKFGFTQDAKITNKDKREIMMNLRTAIINHINSGSGISPQYSDYCTEIIEIEHKNEKLTHDFSLEM